jgi:hypothetical protein
VSAAKEATLNFNSVSDHLALAMFTDRSHRLDGTLEAVEGMPRPGRFYRERLVVFISTNFACCHKTPSGSSELFD